MSKSRPILVTIVVLTILTGGAVAFGWLVRTRPAAPVHSGFKRDVEVAVQVVQTRIEHTPIVGHGAVRPKRQVNIVPQVSGQLVFAHKQLAQGKIIPAGELLFEVDPSLYEAQARQVEAERRGLEAGLERLRVEMSGLDTRIKNLEEMLAIDERDYQTSKGLYENENVGSPQQLDLLYQKYLRSRDALFELENRRSMGPHLLAETEAKLEATRARLSQAHRDLDHTRIHCPFEARVESVTAQESQVVTAHFSVATLTDMEAFELSLSVDPRDLQWLAESIRPSALEHGDSEHLENNEVLVQWTLPGQKFSWRGHVTRFERVDELTRTARMVVEIRRSDLSALTSTDGASVNGSGPMLSIGMYCRAELPAATLHDAVVIPRHAVYEGRSVYVVEPEPGQPVSVHGRLAHRAVTILRAMGDEVLVDFSDRSGTSVEGTLIPGDRLVVSPLIQPVEGMRVVYREVSDAVNWSAQTQPMWGPERLVSVNQSGERPANGFIQRVMPVDPHVGSSATSLMVHASR